MLVAKEDDVKKAERLCGFMESLGLPPSQESLEAMMEFYSAASQEKPGAGKARSQAFEASSFSPLSGSAMGSI